MNIDLNMVSKEIESDTRINSWHHEEFERKDILSITISSKSKINKLNNGTSILDRYENLSKNILYKNIKYLSKVLISLIYDDNNIDNDNNILNERYINNYINYLSKTPRFGPYHHKSSYLKKLKSDLQLNCHETHSMQYIENTNQKFYTTDVIQINVFPVKPWIFDILYLISTLTYLFIVYIIIKRPKNKQEFLDLFAPN